MVGVRYQLPVRPICPNCATQCRSHSVSKLARHYTSQDGRTALVGLLKVCYNAGSSEDADEAVLKEATITYSRGIPQSLKVSDAEFAGEVQFLAAVKLYELGRLSSGKAAELAGMGRVEFLRSLAGVGVPAINLRDEEIDLEVAAARELAQ